MLGLVWLTSAGCSDETIFTSGRIEDLCNGIVPACRRQAGCVLSDDNFSRGVFPGEQRVVVQSSSRDANLILRMLFVEMLYPGTELLAQAFSPDCGDVSLEHVTDVDFFEYAGDDRIIEFQLLLPETGDHLVEVYSDMAAEYLLTVEIDE